MCGIAKRRSKRQCEGRSDARKDHMFGEGHTGSFRWCCDTEQTVSSYSIANRKGLDSQENPSSAARISNDCGEWPARISDDMRQILVERGPLQVMDINFLADYKAMKNVTSASGFSDWKNVPGFLSLHEKSPVHIKAFYSWRELSQLLFCGKTDDEEHQRLIERETEHWRNVLKCLLSVVQFLGTWGLSFRGTTETLFKNDNGNFLQLVEPIAKFDVLMAEHLRRVSSQGSKLII
ncbi:hypothetical protein PR048_009115 [Dryococelus australis]|uniref:Uncharacterized protein n=1 Tax=Dryococelus australis TaxID=614101 RepID=A0ABQ9I026_9NEOP|nr:hypothetical protein PR048_009115 [Dryococelus australis]